MIFTIIVPVFNVEKYLEKCLNSISNQNFEYDYEVILINDGSTDKSLAICKEYIKNNESWILINQKNKGPSAARNAGIKNSKGKYLIFIDSDDYIEKDMLKNIFDVVKNKEVDLICMSYICHNKNKNNTLTIYPKIDSYNTTISGIDYTIKYGKVFSTPVVSHVYKKSFLIENNFYFIEGYFHEDCEFSCKVFMKANEITFIKKPFYNYIYNESSITKSRNLKKCNDLIEISKMILDISEQYINQSKKCSKEISKYASYLSFAAINSCVMQDYDLKKFIFSKNNYSYITKVMPYNKRYFLILLLIKLNWFYVVNLILKFYRKINRQFFCL